MEIYSFRFGYRCCCRLKRFSPENNAHNKTKCRSFPQFYYMLISTWTSEMGLHLIVIFSNFMRSTHAHHLYACIWISIHTRTSERYQAEIATHLIECYPHYKSNFLWKFGALNNHESLSVFKFVLSSILIARFAKSLRCVTILFLNILLPICSKFLILTLNL